MRRGLRATDGDERRGDRRMRVKRKLVTAKILGPQWRCWRCQGRRVVEVTAEFWAPPRFTACPSCNGRDPRTGTQSQAFGCDLCCRCFTHEEGRVTGRASRKKVAPSPRNVAQNALNMVVKLKEGEPAADALAKIALRPSVQAGLTLQGWSRHLGRPIDLPSAVDGVRNAGERCKCWRFGATRGDAHDSSSCLD